VFSKFYSRKTDQDQVSHYTIELGPIKFKTRLHRYTIHKHSMTFAGPPKHFTRKRRVRDEEVWDRIYFSQN
jgi:hypothetical protein